MVDRVLNEVAEAIRADDDDLQIYTSGATNIFKYPELSDGEMASRLIGTLEQKELLQELVDDVNSSESSSGIQVYIGEEAPVQTMRDCGIVTANYELGEGLRERSVSSVRSVWTMKGFEYAAESHDALDSILKKDER